MQQFNDCQSALNFLHSHFQVQNFHNPMWPIFLKQQFYGLLRGRVTVERELETMRQNGDIRLVKLGGELNSSMVTVMRATDYAEAVREYSKKVLPVGLVDRFLDFVLARCPGMSFNKNEVDNIFTDTEITQLMQVGALNIRGLNSWWVGVPTAGAFVRAYSKGNKTMRSLIKRQKFRHILYSELLTRKLALKESTCPLGAVYHIYDLCGAGAIEKVDTTSGPLLRLKM